LTVAMAGRWTIGLVVPGAQTGAVEPAGQTSGGSGVPPPGMPPVVTTAVFTAWPASASAWVTTEVPVSTQVPSTGTTAQVVLAGVRRASSTTTSSSGTLPVLVTVTA